MKFPKCLNCIVLTLALGFIGAFLVSCQSKPGFMTTLPGSRAPSYLGLNGAEARSAAAALGPGPGNGQELWILARGTAEASPTQDKEAPGSGAMITEIEGKHVPMPLKHTDVRARINGYLGEVDVIQQFLNPYSSKIEAVYIFPLPQNAAVNEFIMTIGERQIRGIIRERREAERIYQEARSQGYVASLLTEERPNVFTQSVANIEPGKQIDVQIRYFQTIEYADGWYQFVFPMVVGPRFNPPGSTDGIGAASRGDSGLSGQKTEVHYLKPDERTGHDIALSVEVNAGVLIEEFRCNSHRVLTERPSPDKLRISLDPEDRVPNRDFVLRYRVAGDAIKSSLLTHQDNRGGFFTLCLYPPAGLGNLQRSPVELVFVLDCSGSMQGKPIEHTKAAVSQGLDLLQPGDSFQLINFSMSASQLGNQPVEATPENKRQARAYLQQLRGEGGTMMIEGIRAALNFPHDAERLRFVCFLTDGYIGNEAEILGEIHQRLGASRIFSFGIGSAVNRYLLDEMARAGRGAVAYLSPKDSAPEIMAKFFERISHPALTDVQIDWGQAGVSEVYPRQVPDLFVGRPVIITGRFQHPGPIHITGKTGGHAFTVAAPSLERAEAPRAALACVWARMKIADLANESIRHPNDDITAQITQLALDFNLMSSFTAFVAVDATRRTEGDHGTTVPVAVPVPEGVNYDTTVPQ